MKKVIQIIFRRKKIWLSIWLMGLLYLFLPSSQPPPLPNSLKSKEPGDTIEIPGVSAYYTNLDRWEVLDFYQKFFSRSSLFNLRLPTFTLNHPPEYRVTAIRDTVNATFLYELVHPLKDSLIINGWNPAEDSRFKEAEKVILLEEGRYQQKITLRYLGSSVIIRIIIYSLSLLAFSWLIKMFKLILKETWKGLKESHEFPK